jgi:hypothetical protein
MRKRITLRPSDENILSHKWAKLDELALDAVEDQTTFPLLRDFT